jgi:serine phosphatase RsbU (regulator of sigma subunit)
MAQKRSGGGFGKILFLFSGLSLFLLTLAFHQSFRRFESALQRGRVEVLERKLDSAVAKTHKDYFTLKALEGLMKAILTDGPQGSAFAEAFREIQQKWKLGIQLYVYQNFAIVFKYPVEAPDEKCIGDVLKGISLSGDEFKRARIALREDIERVFGPSQRLDLLKRRNLGLGAIATGTQDQYLLGNFPGSYSLFLRVVDHPDEKGRFTLIPDEERRMLGYAVPLNGFWFPPSGHSPEEMRTAWLRYQEQGQPMIRFGDYEWSFCRNPLGSVWCAISRADGGSDEVLLFRGILVGYAVSAFLLWFFCMSALETGLGLAVSRPLNALSIRVQFLGLFLMSSLIPLGIALLLGALSYLDQKDILIGKATQEAEKRILGLERSYHSVLAQYRRFCVKFSADPMVTAARLDELASHVSLLVDQEKIQHLELRDGSANVLFSTWDPRIHGSPWATELFSKMAIRRHAPNRVGENLKKISAQDIMAESLMASADPAMTVPLRFPGKVWTMGLGGGSQAITFWDVYNDSATGPAFVFMVHQLGWQFRAQVNKLAKSSWSEDTGGLSVLNWGWREDALLGFLPGLSGVDQPELLKASMRVWDTGQSLTRRVRMKDGWYWATIKSNSFLARIVLVNLLSEESQTRSLVPLRWKFLLSTLIAVFLTILGTKILGDLFIVPITDLQGGIVGIQNRDAEFRIPVRRDDEFGIVVTAFNHFIADLKETQAGRVVQESLLPLHSSAPEGYEIEFFRTPATDLAGDYHDVFGLPDGRWVVLIGDVTGHGISAALPMAMAKATIEYQRFVGWEYPTQVMENLNLLFFRELKPSGKYMTTQFLVLNPETHQIMVENAGHGFPLHFQKSQGTCTVPKLGAPPIGFKKTLKSMKTTLDLAAGDAVLLYTDGYTECANAKGEPLDESSLINQFETLMRQGLSPKAILAELMRHLDAFKAPGAYEDDITLVIIKRGD